MFHPFHQLDSAFLPQSSFANSLLNLDRPTAPVSVKRKHEGPRGRIPANQSLVSSKKPYNLKAPPTNLNTVTIPTDDNDPSSDEDVKPIKRKYFENSISLLKEFPGSQKWVSKTAAVTKVFNLAGIVDLLRELVYRQTKVRISSTSPSIRILEKLTTVPSSPSSPSSV